MGKRTKKPASTTGIVLVKKPGEDWRQVSVEVQQKRGITWQTLQGLVGGFYEPLRAGQGSIIVNEDGRVLGMRPCVRVKSSGSPIVLVGPVVVVANQYDDDGATYRGLNPGQIESIVPATSGCRSRVDGDGAAACALSPRLRIRSAAIMTAFLPPCTHRDMSPLSGFRRHVTLLRRPILCPAPPSATNR